MENETTADRLYARPKLAKVLSSFIHLCCRVNAYAALFHLTKVHSEHGTIKVVPNFNLYDSFEKEKTEIGSLFIPVQILKSYES